VVEVTPSVVSVKVGDRVTTAGTGANAEFFRVPAGLVPFLVPLPEHVSFEEAATNEPLATSLHAVNLAEPRDGETLVVMGAGIIGLGVLQVVKAMGSARVIVVDLSDKRLSLAHQLGADLTINAGRENAFDKIIELTGATETSFLDVPSPNVDTVFDCAGVPREFTGTSVLAQSLAMVKQDGKVVVVAVFERPLEIDHNLIVRKGIRLLGSWAWSPAEFVASLALMGSGKVDRKPLITHEYALEDASQAYETQLDAGEAVKVLLKP